MKMMLQMRHTLPQFVTAWSFGLGVDIVCA